MSRIAWTFLTLVVLAGAVAAEELHVAVTGDDANPGTSQRPLRTIQATAERLRPGQTAIVHAGTYRELLRPARSGEPDSPIRLQAARGAEVVLTASEVVTQWEAHDERIFKARFAGDALEVYADGQLLSPARYPNNAGGSWTPTLLAMHRGQDDPTQISGDALDQPADTWKGGTLWAIDENRGWVAHQYRVTSSAPGRLTIDAGRSWWPAGGAGRGYLYGVLAALDAPGEWCVHDGWLYVRLPDDASPEDTLVEVRTGQFAVDLSGRSHIEIEGFRIRGGSLNLDRASHCVLRGLEVTHVSPLKGLRGGFNRDRGISADSEGLGIVLGGSHNVLADSIIAYGAGDGVSVYGQHNSVLNCVIHDFNTSGSDCAPINVTGLGHRIERNTLYNAGRSIVVHRKLRQGRIAHNRMYSAGRLCRDLGMTYTYQTDGEGTEIAYNIIHHNFAGGWGCVGIYLDDLSSNHVVYRNLVYQVNEAIALNPPGSRGNHVHHNTLVGISASIGMSLRRPQDMTGTIIENNIFTAAIPRLENMPNVTIRHNLPADVDAMFVNPQRHDFRLRQDSPAINAGRAIPGQRFVGRAPDAGCFEYSMHPWTAGSSLRPLRDVPDVDIAAWRRRAARDEGETQPAAPAVTPPAPASRED